MNLMICLSFGADGIKTKKGIQVVEMSWLRRIAGEPDETRFATIATGKLLEKRETLVNRLPKK